MAVEPGRGPVTYGASSARLAATTAARAATTPAQQDYEATPPPTTTPTAACTSASCSLVARLGLRRVHRGRAALGIKDRIPRFEEISERLYKATRWEIVACQG
jgi:phenylalanine-4-hydroxylase